VEKTNTKELAAKNTFIIITAKGLAGWLADQT
jgi:hypothetical protein